MAIHPFSQKHLTNDQVDKMYLAALSQMEAQMLEAHINCLIDQSDEASAKRFAKLTAGLPALEEEYEAWILSNSSDDSTA